MTHSELRKAFVDYFTSKGHTAVPSSPIVPLNDPSLMFTTAGMVQFKPLFAGVEKRAYTRAISVQKCFRLSDLEHIGKTARHHTFFEMFGNFSFGDYFKKEAIEFAWEFSTKILNLPKERIYISIYENDDEAFDLWNVHIGVDAKRIVRLGNADNFWGPAGASGACGPCSELYIDMGKEKSCGKPDCFVGCDCERYLEYWNLVFNEFFQDERGVQTPLPQTGIDTGMGMERLCYIMQGVESNYQTDLMKPIVDQTLLLSKAKYEGEAKYAVNVIADHVRALVFVLSEGVIPSNEGRGYVLRRLLRRSLNAGALVGLTSPFLHTLVDVVVDIYKEVYPYLEKERAAAKGIILSEEKRFFETLSHGLKKLSEMIAAHKEKGENALSGEELFALADTYGLPFEIALEEAEEAGYSADVKRYETLLEEQRARSRGKGAEKERFDYIIETEKTVYCGDDEAALLNGVGARVIGIYNKGDRVTMAKAGETVLIIADQTPFYAEKGGQVGDTGAIITLTTDRALDLTFDNTDGWFEEVGAETTTIEVIDTKDHNGVTAHIAKIRSGAISEDDVVTLLVDRFRRNAIRRNHTATHILQKALQQRLGEHAKQAGSYVGADRLRFDFTHFETIRAEALLEIENDVNRVIAEEWPVTTKVVTKEEALSEGATALFGEKYGATVRIVDINGWSKEFCGGSHVVNTATIGFFHIVQESSIASGVRRIEAVTGYESARYAGEGLCALKEIGRILQERDSQSLIKRVNAMQEETKRLQKEMTRLKTKGVAANGAENAFDAETIDGVTFLKAKLDGEDMRMMRARADGVKEREQSHALVMASTDGESAPFIVQASKSAVAKGINAGELLKRVIEEFGGKGGGKDSFAQGALTNRADVDAAFTRAREYIVEKLT